MEREPRELVSDYDRRNVTGSGPYQVEVAGGLGEVRFPALCARCGAPPAGTLPIRKLFRRTYSDSPTRNVHAHVAAPFCRGCIAAHEAERQPPDPRVLRTLRNRWIASTIPYWIPVGVIVYMLTQLGPTAFEALAGGERVEQLVWLGVLLVFTVALLGFVRVILGARRNLIADHAGDPNDQYVELARGPLGVGCVLPGPPTATLAAVNFTDEEPELLAKNRRTFTFTNLDVATAFAATNADLVWEPNSPTAIRARWARNAVAVVVVVAAVVFWLRDLLGL